MPELIPACFRGGAAAARPPAEEEEAAAAAGPSLTTSVYETRLGLVSLSWSRTALGLSLLAELRLRDDGGDDDEEEPLAFRIRPWLFWKRRGSKRFHLGDRRGSPQTVELAWDLARARFPPGGAPEPAGGYFVSVAVDGEAALVAGDLRGEASKRAAARSAPRGEALLISRREHVAMGRDVRSGARSYATSALFGGKEREITITLTSKEKEKERKGKGKGEDMAMSIAVDGSLVLHVRRLRWKFRGSDTVDVDSSPVQISWDLHSWLFPPRAGPGAGAGADRDAAAAAPPPPPPPPPPRAVFVFRFERERESTQLGDPPKTKCESEGSALGKKKRGSSSFGGYVGEYLGKLSRRNWSESSSCGGERTRTRTRTRRRKKKSLLKTSSSSSTASSTASTISGSTVMDWASAEEAEMQRGEGFSLLVYALKS